MPAFIKTPAEEARWSKAKQAAAKSKGKAVEALHDDDYKLVNYIYHKMGKTEEDQKMAKAFETKLLAPKTTSSETKMPNPMKSGTPTSVKTPKAKRPPDPFGKKSLLLKSEHVEEFSDELIEALAELEHEQWVEWSKDIAKKESISSERLKRWESCWKPYAELSEEMKELDRIWARKALNIFYGLNKSEEIDNIKHPSICKLRDFLIKRKV